MFEIIITSNLSKDTHTHTNSHNHALVQNPFAWDEEAEQEQAEK